MSIVESHSSPPSKGQEILLQLRDEIVTGELRPGAQLPLRTQIEQRFDACSVTVQRALDQLMRDGFVWSSRGRGTFVADNPPHLCHYALVFEHGLEGSQFWTALREEAMHVAQRRESRVSIYHHVNAQGGSPDEHRLLADIRAQRLAGLVFVSSPYSLIGRPVLTEPGVERVALMSKDTIPGISAVWVDEEGLVERALNVAARRGRRRVAVLRNTSEGELDADSHWHRWPEMVASRGMETRPYWLLPLPIGHAGSLRQAVHLLMNPRQQEHPDVLIITDDNMVEAATTGLLAAGCRVPHDIEVIAHANFPLPTRSHVPAIRLGFDVGRMLHAAFDAIDRRRCGQDVPPVTLVPVTDGGGDVLIKD